MKPWSWWLALALCAALLSGCQGMRPAPRAHPLAGTSWELVAIASPDDAQGHTQIAHPARFTLRFGPGRRALLRLDCNRGVGSWRAQASTADAGSLSFGTIATTRALCQPPHLDERIGRDLAFVRSYALRDGRLYLAPLADGDVLEWRPRAEK